MKPCAGLSIAPRSGQICVFTSDGWVSIYNGQTLQREINPQKHHNMPICNAKWVETQNTIVTAGSDFRYNLVNLRPASSTSKRLLMQIALLILILLYFADYLV